MTARAKPPGAAEIPTVRAHLRHVPAGPAGWRMDTSSDVPRGTGRVLGEFIENHYSNHYSAPHLKSGKLKYVIHMRMWRNWQTRRI
jgi:hypothetical protein